MIRDRIVVGIRDSKLSEKLQMDAGLTLDLAVTALRQSEAVKKQQATLRGQLQEDSSVGSPNRSHGTANPRVAHSEHRAAHSDRRAAHSMRREAPRNRNTETFARDAEGLLPTEGCNALLETQRVTTAQ